MNINEIYLIIVLIGRSIFVTSTVRPAYVLLFVLFWLKNAIMDARTLYSLLRGVVKIYLLKSISTLIGNLYVHMPKIEQSSEYELKSKKIEDIKNPYIINQKSTTNMETINMKNQKKEVKS